MLRNQFVPYDISGYEDHDDYGLGRNPYDVRKPATRVEKMINPPVQPPISPPPEEPDYNVHFRIDKQLVFWIIVILILIYCADQLTKILRILTLIDAKTIRGRSAGLADARVD